MQQAVSNINQGLKANETAINASAKMNAGMNVSQNLGTANANAAKAANQYTKAANNLRKMNLNRAANSFENAAKKSLVGDAVGAARSAGAGIRAIMKSNNGRS
jgi:hypothetical protein